jgi:NADH-quinone oxidoreductase subunit I
MTPRYRGAHRLLLRADGSTKCVACMCCPTICPAKCINIIAGEDPNDPAEKFPVVFEIDMLRCIYCGFCVEACPKDAIRMDTKIYEINAYTRQDMVHTKSYMVNLMDGAKPEAAKVYRQDPAQAPAGYTFDEPPVV